MSDTESLRIKEIEQALKNKDVYELRKLSRHGFVNNDLRKKVWPLLLGVTDNENNKMNESQQQHNNNNNYSDQIKKDIVRSMYHFDVTKKFSNSEREREQKALERILNGIFGRNADMHYTQGFNDLCSVFYIVCGEDLGQKLSSNLAQRHQRDMTRSDMSVYSFVLKLLFPLLSLVDNDLFVALQRNHISAIFALSWLLTWFAHNIESFEQISRCFDYFLSTHPLMPLYFSVALILKCKERLLCIEDIDQAQIHEFFQEYDWRNIKNYDAIIAESDAIFYRFPPHDLFRTYFIEELKQIPKDSPFLASDINEVANMKPSYSGHGLVSIWNYQNPKFWKFIALPIVTACVLSYIANSHITKS